MDFKWKTYAKNIHLVGFIAHMAYVVIMMLYVDVVYINNVEDENHHLVITLLILAGIAYPTAYDFTQAYREGLRSYLKDFGNYADMIYIWASIVNVIL